MGHKWCAGMIVPELLDGTKHVPWFKAGATIFGDKGIQYLGVPGLINAKSIVATLLVQVGCSLRKLCSKVQLHQACLDAGLQVSVGRNSGARLVP